MKAIVNKKAYFDYDILDKIEAGIVLHGMEVKSVRGGQVNLSGSFVRIEVGELWLYNCKIPLYKFSQDKNYSSDRRRKLLVKREEINKLYGKIQSGGLTIVPLKIYSTKYGKIKMEIGLCRGKKKFEKKLRQKERDLDRELHRERREYVGL